MATWICPKLVNIGSPNFFSSIVLIKTITGKNPRTYLSLPSEIIFFYNFSYYKTPVLCKNLLKNYWPPKYNCALCYSGYKTYIWDKPGSSLVDSIVLTYLNLHTFNFLIISFLKSKIFYWESVQKYVKLKAIYTIPVMI